MRFRTTQRPRGLLARRDTTRLTLLVVGLGVIFIGVRLFGRPEFWARVFPDPVAEDASRTDPKSPSEEAPLTHSSLRPPLRLELSAPEENSVVSIPQDLLTDIDDNVVGVRPSEARAFFVGLRQAEWITPTDARMLPPARYALLMDSPDFCRGKAWSIKGRLRRLTIETPTHSSLKNEKLVDAWISLPDSGDSLIHVMALRKDPAIKESPAFGENPPEVQLSGIFFKREAYHVADEIRGLTIAPLLLADEISLIPDPVITEARSDQLTPWLGWLALVTCGGILVMVWTFAVSDANNRGQRTHELTRLPSSVSFNEIEVVSPDEAIRRLQSEIEQAADYSVPEARL